MDSLGCPRSVAVLGGTSHIGLAIAQRLCRNRVCDVVLAGRDLEGLERAAATLGERSAESGHAESTKVRTVEFDAEVTADHDGTADNLFSEGDLDVVVFAFGLLGDQATISDDPDRAVRLAQVNYTGTVSMGLRVARRLRAQGHGTMVFLSSVAGERARRSNFVYGSSKAGLDAFAQGLSMVLVGTGVRVLIVRPGFVSTPMTAGMDAAPMSATPEAVAESVAKALAMGSEIIWVPRVLRPLMTGVRHLPRSVMRRVKD